jgi:integrase
VQLVGVWLALVAIGDVRDRSWWAARQCPRHDDDGLNKRKPPARIHSRLLPDLRRWHRLDSEHGITHVVRYMGEPIRKLRRAWASVGGGRDGPHVVRHTAVTWFMQAGVDAFEAAG